MRYAQRTKPTLHPLKPFPSFLTLILILSATLAHAAEKSLFNGKDLTGWEGQPEFWSVKDGAITGQTTKDLSAKENTFLIWTAAKSPTSNSLQIQDHGCRRQLRGLRQLRHPVSQQSSNPSIRSSPATRPTSSAAAYSGILYEEKGRGILAQRGQKIVIKDGSKIEVDRRSRRSTEIQAAIKPADWNEYKIIAKGGHLQHFINGKQPWT